MRLVIADGHPITRLGIKSLLLATEARVVGEAGEGEEVLRIVEETRPDLVVLGLNLDGGTDGVEACRSLKGLPEPPRVLVHDAYASSGNASASLLAGADGYLHKRACHLELLDAIRRTAAGERVWTPGGANGGSPARIGSEEGGAVLTRKEQEVLALVLRRYSNPEVARKLHLALPTVKTHVRSILRKTGAKSRGELIGPHAPDD